MNFFYIRLATFLFVFVLSSCSSVQSRFCELRGGAPYGNLGGYQYCGKKYSDARQVCTASTQCEGSCMLPWDWKPDEEREVIGRCEVDSTREPIVGCSPVEDHETYTGGCLME